MPSFSDKNITFTGEINRKGIAAMMEQLNKDAEQDGTLDLADLRVFKRQYEDNFRSLKYFGMQYIADEDVVSDLIQDTWLKIWERQETFPSLAAFRRYLFQVLYHAILNYLKHARVEHDFADRLSLSEPVEEEVAVKMIESLKGSCRRTVGVVAWPDVCCPRNSCRKPFLSVTRMLKNPPGSHFMSAWPAPVAL